MRKKGLSRVLFTLAWLITMQVFAAYGVAKPLTDSTTCALNTIGNDCACKFTEARELKQLLNSMDDNCVLSIVDRLIDNSSNFNCRTALDRIIAVSDGYLSDYLGYALASALLRDPKKFFSSLYNSKGDKQSGKRSLLVAGLSQLYVRNPDILINLDLGHLKRKEKRELNSIQKDIVHYIHLNPDL